MLALALNHNGYDESPIIANIYINPKANQITKLEESFAELDPTKPFLAMGDLKAIALNTMIILQIKNFQNLMTYASYVMINVLRSLRILKYLKLNKF